MKITAHINSNAEITAFVSQHKPDTTGYLIGNGATLLGYTGKCTVEDLLSLVANKDNNFVHVKISAPAHSKTPTAVNAIVEMARELEQHVYGFQVVDDILGSFPAGMVAGLIIHERTASGWKVPHGHLIAIPRVVTTEHAKIYIHQLDVMRLLAGIRG